MDGAGDIRAGSIGGEGLWVDRELGIAGRGDRRLDLSAAEVAMLAVLVGARGKVLDRHELARRAGLDGASPRRCDGVLVGLRRALGDGALRNVRGRGWGLADYCRAPADGVVGDGLRR